MSRQSGSVPAVAISLAQQHLANGERAKAAALLGAVLRRFEPATAPREDSQLFAAARLWCQTADDDDAISGQWAGYVHEAATRHDPDSRTVDSATEVAAPALVAASDPLAVVVRDLQLQALLAAPSMSPAVIAEGRLALAEMLHHVGSCARAVEVAQSAWVHVCQSDSDTILCSAPVPP